MKNIARVVFCFLFLSFSFSYSSKSRTAFDFFSQGRCEFFVASLPAQTLLPEGVTTMYNGMHFVVGAPTSLGKYLHGFFDDIKGITVYLQQSFSEVAKQFNAKFFAGENVEGNQHYYGFSPHFDNFVFVKGKKVNMHFVQKHNQTIVGLPIILGSY